MTPWLLCTAAIAMALWSHGRLHRRAVLVAQACHELRGALACLSLAVEAGTGGEGAELALRRAVLSAEDLTLASAGRRAAGRVEQVDLGRLARDVAAPFGMDVRVLGPVTAWGDRDRIGQGIANLIRNAAQHGGGRPSISVAGGGAGARVEVADSGPGLPAGLDDLLRRARRRTGPHGHGLAVADRVARGCGGRLLAEPSDAGARLVLELPEAAR